MHSPLRSLNPAEQLVLTHLSAWVVKPSAQLLTQTPLVRVWPAGQAVLMQAFSLRVKYSSHSLLMHSPFSRANPLGQDSLTHLLFLRAKYLLRETCLQTPSTMVKPVSQEILTQLLSSALKVYWAVHAVLTHLPASLVKYSGHPY